MLVRTNFHFTFNLASRRLLFPLIPVYHTADKTIREKMTLLPRTAQSLFKMHPPRGGNDFRARGCGPPQTFNDLFEFLAERPCVGARQTEDAPSTICVGVCDRGSKRVGEVEAWWIQCANRSLKTPERCRLFRSTAECLEYLC